MVGNSLEGGEVGKKGWVNLAPGDATTMFMQIPCTSYLALNRLYLLAVVFK